MILCVDTFVLGSSILRSIKKILIGNTSAFQKNYFTENHRTIKSYF